MANVCVGASATGSGNGTDWNNQAAWASLSFTRGNTYYLADGTYAGKSLSTALSGSTLITIKKAIESDHGTATGWSSAFGDGQAIISTSTSGLTISTGYWLIDGQAGTSNNDDYGIKIVSSGVGDGHCAMLARGGAGISHSTFRYISFQVPVSSGSSSNRAFEELTNVYGSGVSTNLLIQHCHFKGGVANLSFCGDGSTDQGNIVEYCLLELAGNQQHSESVQLANTKNITLRFNVFQDLLNPSTTYIEPQQNGPDNPIPTGIYIYGNVFRATNADEGTENPSVLSSTSGETVLDVLIYNNTFYGLHGCTTQEGFADTGVRGDNANSTITVRNNIWQSCSHDPGFQAVQVHDHNLLNTGGASFIDAAGGNFHLAAALPGGVALPSPYDTDPDGRVRTTWSLGAYEMATNWYVRPSAAGLATGADWDNAWSMANLNSNWSSVKPGDTVWIAGGTYATGMLPTKSGSPGSPIFIKRPRTTDSVPTAAAGWSSGFDAQVLIAPPLPTGSPPLKWTDSAGAGSYLTFDGRIDSGIKFLKANNLTGSAYTGAVVFARGSKGQTGITLNFCDLSGPATGDAPSFDFGGTDGDGYVCALSLDNNFDAQPAYTNIVLNNCRLHGCNDTVLATHATGLVFDHCIFYDNGSGNSVHANLMELHGCGSVTIRYCDISDWQIEGIRPYESIGVVECHGNVIHDTNNAVARFWEPDGAVARADGPLHFYNNTVVNVDLAVFSGAAGVTWAAGSASKNNIFWGCGDNGNSSMPVDDYNFSDKSGVNGAHSISSGSNPFVDYAGGDYHIIGSVAANLPRDKGVNLGLPYNLDFDGVARGADGLWDIGAYEYTSGISLPPTIVTGAASGVTSSGATLNGTVNPNGSPTVFYFEYGLTTSYGLTTPGGSAGSGSGPVAVAESISPLLPGTTYHFRLVASNGAGVTHGSDATFTTLQPPTVVTGAASIVTLSSAVLSATVNPNGSDTTWAFEYGPTLAYGSLSVGGSAGNGSAAVDVQDAISGLAPATTYHFRIKGTSASGTSVGADNAFTTGNLAAPPVITSPDTAEAEVGKQFTYQIEADNDPSRYSANKLPRGLKLNKRTGVISGIPTDAGTFKTKLRASN